MELFEIIIWLFCSCMNYILMRAQIQKDLVKWNVFLRLVVIVSSLLGGPVSLLITLFMNGYMKLSETKWGKRKANW